MLALNSRRKGDLIAPWGVVRPLRPPGYGPMLHGHAQCQTDDPLLAPKLRRPEIWENALYHSAYVYK